MAVGLPDLTNFLGRIQEPRPIRLAAQRLDLAGGFLTPIENREFRRLRGRALLGFLVPQVCFVGDRLGGFVGGARPEDGTAIGQSVLAFAARNWPNPLGCALRRFVHRLDNRLCRLFGRGLFPFRCFVPQSDVDVILPLLPDSLLFLLVAEARQGSRCSSRCTRRLATEIEHGFIECWLRRCSRPVCSRRCAVPMPTRLGLEEHPGCAARDPSWLFGPSGWLAVGLRGDVDRLCAAGRLRCCRFLRLFLPRRAREIVVVCVVGPRSIVVYMGVALLISYLDPFVRFLVGARNVMRVIRTPGFCGRLVALPPLSYFPAPVSGVPLPAPPGREPPGLVGYRRIEDRHCLVERERVLPADDEGLAPAFRRWRRSSPR